MRRQRLIPLLLVPVVCVLLATTSFAGDDPAAQRREPAVKAFAGPRWEEPRAAYLSA